MNAEGYIPIIIMMGAMGLLCSLLYFIYAIYLAHKWLPSVEMTMTGQNIFTTNIFYSIHAIILFGSIFTWDWHARRQEGRMELREKVPISVRRKFVFAYFFLWFGFLLIIVPAGILELLGALRINQ